MSEWKERGKARRDYRRGGQEPDPPRPGKNKKPKPYRVEAWMDSCGFLCRLFNIEPYWRGLGRYHRFSDAVQAMDSLIHKKVGTSPMYSQCRVVDTRNGNTVAETGSGLHLVCGQHVQHYEH